MSAGGGVCFSAYEVLIGLAGNVGDMSAKCHQRVEMLPIFAQNTCRCRHQNSPDTEFCVGFLATLYHIPRSYIRTNTHTKNLHTHKDPLPLPQKNDTIIIYLLLQLNNGTLKVVEWCSSFRLLRCITFTLTIAGHSAAS
jgi:hypothetical protein